MSSSYPPGWYHLDSDPPQSLRWYDGNEWTGQVRRQPDAWTNAFTRAGNAAPMRRLAPAAATAPPELWLISVAMVVVSLLLLWPVVRYGFSALGALFSGDDLGRALGALVLIVLVMLAAIGVALLLLAVGLLRASRVAQILTCGVSALTGLGALLLGSSDLLSGATTTLVVLICIGICAGVVGRAPVREFFATDTRPLGVATAAVANVYFGWVLALDGVLLMIAGVAGARFVVIGLLLLAGAVALIRTGRPLQDGSRNARAAVLTAYAVIALLLIVFTAADGGSAAGLIVPLGLVVAGTIGLTVPTSSKVHFGDRVLPAESV